MATTEKKQYEVSAGFLIVSLFVLAMGSLATVVVLLALTDTDSLATIALLFALVTFAGQLALAGFQEFRARQSERTVEGVAHEMSTSLTEIRESAAATREMLLQQYGQLLQRVLGEVVPSAVDESTGGSLKPDDLAEDLLSRIQQGVQQEITTMNSGPTPLFRVGEKVGHAQFGRGIVGAVAPKSDGDVEVIVDFERFGQKRMSARWANLVSLEPVDPDQL